MQNPVEQQNLSRARRSSLQNTQRPVYDTRRSSQQPKMPNISEVLVAPPSPRTSYMYSPIPPIKPILKTRYHMKRRHSEGTLEGIMETMPRGTHPSVTDPKSSNSIELSEREKDRENLQELIRFFKTTVPPSYNWVSETDSTHSSKKSTLKVLRWRGGRSKGENDIQQLLRLPDSAVAQKTSNGHWHIAISIPKEYDYLCDAGKQIAHEPLQTSRSNTFTSSSTYKGPITVLKPPTPKVLKRATSADARDRTPRPHISELFDPALKKSKDAVVINANPLRLHPASSKSVPDLSTLGGNNPHTQPRHRPVPVSTFVDGDVRSLDPRHSGGTLYSEAWSSDEYHRSSESQPSSPTTTTQAGGGDLLFRQSYSAFPRISKSAMTMNTTLSKRPSYLTEQGQYLKYFEKQAGNDGGNRISLHAGQVTPMPSPCPSPWLVRGFNKSVRPDSTASFASSVQSVEEIIGPAPKKKLPEIPSMSNRASIQGTPNRATFQAMPSRTDSSKSSDSKRSRSAGPARMARSKTTTGTMTVPPATRRKRANSLSINTDFPPASTDSSPPVSSKMRPSSAYTTASMAHSQATIIRCQPRLVSVASPNKTKSRPASVLTHKSRQSTTSETTTTPTSTPTLRLSTTIMTVASTEPSSPATPCSGTCSPQSSASHQSLDSLGSLTFTNDKPPHFPRPASSIYSSHPPSRTNTISRPITTTTSALSYASMTPPHSSCSSVASRSSLDEEYRVDSPTITDGHTMFAYPAPSISSIVSRAPSASSSLRSASAQPSNFAALNTPHNPNTAPNHRISATSDSSSASKVLSERRMQRRLKRNMHLKQKELAYKLERLQGNDQALVETLQVVLQLSNGMRELARGKNGGKVGKGMEGVSPLVDSEVQRVVERHIESLREVEVLVQKMKNQV